MRNRPKYNFHPGQVVMAHFYGLRTDPETRGRKPHIFAHWEEPFLEDPVAKTTDGFLIYDLRPLTVNEIGISQMKLTKPTAVLNQIHEYLNRGTNEN